MDMEEQCPLKLANEMASHLIWLMETGLYLNPAYQCASKMERYSRFCRNLRIPTYYDLRYM